MPTAKVGTLPGDITVQDQSDDDYDDDELDPVARPQWNLGEVRIVKLVTAPHWTMARLFYLSLNFFNRIAFTNGLGSLDFLTKGMVSGWGQFSGCSHKTKFPIGKVRGYQMAHPRKPLLRYDVEYLSLFLSLLHRHHCL